jgi:peroxiredoxin
MKLPVGEKAPEFELRSDTTERVGLSAPTGSKLLLLFVPLAFTST